MGVGWWVVGGWAGGRVTKTKSTTTATTVTAAMTRMTTTMRAGIVDVNDYVIRPKVILAAGAITI